MRTIADCFHDFGMWSGDVVEYLAPSIAMAQECFVRRSNTEWSTASIAQVEVVDDFCAADL